MSYSEIKNTSKKNPIDNIAQRSGEGSSAALSNALATPHVCPRGARKAVSVNRDVYSMHTRFEDWVQTKPDPPKLYVISNRKNIDHT